MTKELRLFKSTLDALRPSWASGLYRNLDKYTQTRTVQQNLAFFYEIWYVHVLLMNIYLTKRCSLLKKSTDEFLRMRTSPFGYQIPTNRSPMKEIFDVF